MFGSMGQTSIKNLGNGGTIDGDLVISGDLTVSGGGSLSFDEIIEGTQVIDVTSTEALLVRKNGDGGDILTVDTTNSKVIATELDISGNIDVDGTSNLDDVDIDGDVDISGSITMGGNITITNNTGTVSYLNLDADGDADSKFRIVFKADKPSDGNGIGDIQFFNNGASPVTEILALRGSTDIKGDLVFNTSNSERMRIDEDGNLRISSTNKLEFGDNGTYIHQSADGVLDLVSDTEIELTAGLIDIDTTTLDINGTAINFESASADSPILTIKNTNAGDGSPRFYFNHDSSTPADNDELGQIRYYGDNSNGDSEMFVQVKANATTVADGSEASKLSFITKTGGSEVNNLILDGGKVGIGIAPASGTGQLHIDGGSSPARMQFTNSATGQTSGDGMALGLDPDNNRFYFWNYDQTNTEFAVGGAVRFKIDANSAISLSNNDSGTSNTVFGKSAGNIDSNSNYNTFVGENVSDASMNGATSNTAIGYSSASGLTSGDNNVMVGSTSGQSATTSSKSVYIGAEAGEGANHNHNTYVGYQAGKVSGNSDNTAVGYLALGSGSNGYSNVAIGREALKNTTGHMAVAVGEGAMQENTSGQYNVAVGWSALRTNVDGDKNTAVGYKSLYTFEADTDGHGLNSALGWESGTDLTTGTENTLIGANSGANLTDGDKNTALGSYALAQTIAGSSNNTALGYYALGAGDVTNSGITAVGAYALAENVAGQKNVAVGFQAGNVLTAGSQNTVIGYDADTDDNSATNQTVIGSEVTGVADNSVTLGNASVTAVYMAQDSGAMVHSGGLTTSGAVLTQGMSDNTDRFVVTDDGSNYKGGIAKKSGSMGGLFVRGASSKIGVLTNSSYASNPSGDTEALMVSSADASTTFGGAIIPNAGINFPDTPVESADANTLDDYEEGLVTNLSITFGGNSASQTYNSSRNQARYTKVGNRVFIGGFIELSAKGSSTGSAKISGLPFTIQNHTGANSGGSIGYISGVSFADFPMISGENNTTNISFAETTNSGTTTTLTEGNFTDSSNVIFSFHYNTQ